MSEDILPLLHEIVDQQRKTHAELLRLRKFVSDQSNYDGSKEELSPLEELEQALVDEKLSIDRDSVVLLARKAAKVNVDEYYSILSRFRTARGKPCNTISNVQEKDYHRLCELLRGVK